MNALTIVIRASDNEEGYLYDVYKSEPNCALADNADGGLCTTTMLNALGMAVSQAEELIKREKGEECPGCWVDMGGSGQPPQAISRFGNGRLCSACGTREALEGDFIAER